MSAMENEKEAVRTTIVGGRPPGCGRDNGTIPRGIEVLLKKAAVDPGFCEKLLDRRAAAAAEIELDLDPAESAILSIIPREQLAQIITQTRVPVEHRRVFLGRVATAMFAVLSAGLAGCQTPGTERPEDSGIATEGIRPDRPPRAKPTGAVISSMGIRPDPPAAPPPVPFRIWPQ